MLVDRRTISAGIVASMCLLASEVYSQAPDATTAKPDQWLIGMSLGIPGMQHNTYPSFATFGLQFTQVNPGRIGGDIAIGTMPYLIANGMIPFGFRGNITVPFVMPHLIVLPSAGVSAIGVASPGGGGGTLGVNGGIAAVVHSAQLGLRAGISWHQFEGMNGLIWLAELGFVSIGVDPP